MVEVIRSKKRYSGKPLKVWEFGLEFYRGADPVVHEFKAYPAMDAGGLSYTLSATHKPERAIEGIVRSIRKMLADDDGTPADWRPSRYEPPLADDEDDASAAPSVEEFEGFEPLNPEEPEPLRRFTDAIAAVEEDADEFDPEDADLLFLGPDNEPITGEKVTEALRFENGSSRRRFAFLMDEDESLTLDIEQLQTVYKKLLAQVADRPTRR